MQAPGTSGKWTFETSSNYNLRHEIYHDCRHHIHDHSISFHDVRDEVSYIVQNRYFVYEIMTAAMIVDLRSVLARDFLTFFLSGHPPS